ESTILHQLARNKPIHCRNAGRNQRTMRRALHWSETHEGKKVIERIAADFPVVNKIAGRRANLPRGVFQRLRKRDGLYRIVRQPLFQHFNARPRCKDHDFEPFAVQVLNDSTHAAEENVLMPPRDEKADSLALNVSGTLRVPSARIVLTTLRV